MAENRFYLASSPHFSMNLSTQKIMLFVIIALLPECVYGVVIFGFSALAVIFTGVLSCVLFELLFQFATRQKLLIRDLSAVVSGILLALVCPSTVPLWIVVLGGAVAMIVAKGLFGTNRRLFLVFTKRLWKSRFPCRIWMPWQMQLCGTELPPPQAFLR